jgi:hypothetical protein
MFSDEPNMRSLRDGVELNEFGYGLMKDYHWPLGSVLQLLATFMSIVQCPRRKKVVEKTFEAGHSQEQPIST